MPFDLSAIDDDRHAACRPDDATLAILRSALAAAGEVSDGDWPYVREQVSRSLVNKLLKLDPKVRGRRGGGGRPCHPCRGT